MNSCFGFAMKSVIGFRIVSFIKRRIKEWKIPGVYILIYSFKSYLIRIMYSDLIITCGSGKAGIIFSFFTICIQVGKRTGPDSHMEDTGQ